MAQQNVKPNGYRPRIVDKQIERYMRIFGAVEIAGTKWCGKTWPHARTQTASPTSTATQPAHDRQTHRLCSSGDRPHVIDRVGDRTSNLDRNSP